MKYRVVEYYSYIGKTLWFRVEYKHSWIHHWEGVSSFDTKEQAIEYINNKKQIRKE